MNNINKKLAYERKEIIKQLKNYIIEHKDRLNKDMLELVKSL